MLSDPVFEFGPQEFDRGSPESRFPSSPDYDLDGPGVILCWFRRDEYIDQTFLGAHGKAGTDGWRFMLKGCEPEHQFVNIQFDVNNPQRNIYKVLKPINNKYDHFCAWVWNPGDPHYDGYECYKYTDADGRTTERDGVPGCLVFDGSVDHIWRCKDACSSVWTVAPADRRLGIGCDSVTGLPKFGMTGAVYEFKIFKGDYSIEDAIEYYNDTKDNYNLEPNGDEEMTSTLYIDDLSVSTKKWYVGLGVSVTVVVGCATPCENCAAGLNIGLSKSTSPPEPDYAPKKFKVWEKKNVEPGCGETEHHIFAHTITQEDIDHIDDGIKQCCAFIAGGKQGEHYAYETIELGGGVCDPACTYECDVVDKYDQECVDGVCRRGDLIEANSPDCGYVPPSHDCEGDATQTITCPDGTSIVTHTCVDRKWVATGNECPEDEEEEEEEKASGTSSTLYIIAAVILLYLLLRG